MFKADETYLLTTQKGRSISVSVFDKLVPYEHSYESMATFARQRTKEDIDQIWVLQHSKVYTQGTACNLTAFLPSDIPTVKTDRGGQITYHGPGQIVIYPMLALRQHEIGVKSLVFKLEQSMIDTLAEFGINADRRKNAPGVYVNQDKIGALGLRIRQGTSYHGLSLNVDMDLSPFSNIDPCGYQGLNVCNVVDHASEKIEIRHLANTLVANFVKML